MLRRRLELLVGGRVAWSQRQAVQVPRGDPQLRELQARTGDQEERVTVMYEGEPRQLLQRRHLEPDFVDVVRPDVSVHLVGGNAVHASKHRDSVDRRDADAVEVEGNRHLDGDLEPSSRLQVEPPDVTEDGGTIASTHDVHVVAARLDATVALARRWYWSLGSQGIGLQFDPRVSREVKDGDELEAVAGRRSPSSENVDPLVVEDHLVTIACAGEDVVVRVVTLPEERPLASEETELEDVNRVGVASRPAYRVQAVGFTVHDDRLSILIRRHLTLIRVVGSQPLPHPGSQVARVDPVAGTLAEGDSCPSVDDQVVAKVGSSMRGQLLRVRTLCPHLRPGASDAVKLPKVTEERLRSVPPLLLSSSFRDLLSRRVESTEGVDVVMFITDDPVTGSRAWDCGVEGQVMTVSQSSEQEKHATSSSTAVLVVTHVWWAAAAAGCCEAGS